MTPHKRRRRGRPSRSFFWSEVDVDASIDDGSCVHKNLNSPEASSSGYTNSRCSVRQLSIVIETFDDVKKQLVSEIGFHGLLKLNNFNNLNRQFSIWLLGKVDCDEHCLVLDDQKIIPFGPADVSNVLGIPSGEKDVLGSAAQIHDRGLEYMRECIGLDAANPRSLKSVQEFLMSDIGTEPTSFQKDCFKIAFVVFAVGSFLAPSAKHNHVSTAFWGALRCTNDIQTFNWGAYVIKVLIESARKVQSDITNKRAVKSINGCHLFLQVLYLDNIWIQGLSTHHDVLPRINAFGTDTLNSFIAAISTEDGFLLHELRDSRSVCYTWGQLGPAVGQQSDHRGTAVARGNDVIDSRFTIPNPVVLPVTPATSIPLHSSETRMPRATDQCHQIRDTYPDLTPEKDGGKASATRQPPRKKSCTDKKDEVEDRHVWLDSDAKSIDCGICFMPFEAEIFMCNNGHAACAKCCVRINRKCWCCGEAIGDIRCRLAESMLAEMNTHCRFSRYGCVEIVKYIQKRKHEETCPHAPYKYPIDDCSYHGMNMDLYEHVLDEHADKIASATNLEATTVTLHKSVPFRMLVRADMRKVFLLLNGGHVLAGRSLSLVCLGPRLEGNVDIKYKMEVHDSDGGALSLVGITRWWE